MNQPEERYPAIAKQIASAYPVIHERVLWLYLAFLEHKCKYGVLEIKTKCIQYQQISLHTTYVHTYVHMNLHTEVYY